MLDMLRKKSRTFGIYLVFAALIVIFAIGFGATPDAGCGGNPGTFRNVEFVDADGESIDAVTVRLAGDLTGDAPTARQPQADFAYLARFSQVGLYSAWSGARFARGPETASPIKVTKVTDDVVEQKLVASWARSLGLHVSKKELQESLALLLDNFRDVKTGVFDANSYRGWIQGLGVSTSGFESFISEEILRERVIQLLVGEVGVSDAELELAHRLEKETVTVEHIIVDDMTALSFVPVTDADVNEFVAANADKVQAEYEKVKAFRYTTPKTLTLRAIRVSAADPTIATDDEQRVALEEERKGAKDRADQALAAFNTKLAAPPAPGVDGALVAITPAAVFSEVAAQVSDDDSKANGGLIGDVKLSALSGFPYHPAIGTAAATLVPGTPSAVIETPSAFWILLADAIAEETVTPFEQVKNEVAKSLVQATKVAEFKKTLADEAFAEAKKDPTKPLADTVEAIHAKYNVKDALAVGTATFARVGRFGPTSPASSPFISAFGGKVPTLVAQAFAASAEKPFIDQLVNIDEGRRLVVARFIEKTPAPTMTDEEKRDLRNTMVWERRRSLYRGWYEDLYAKKVADGDIDTTKAYEERKKADEEAFVQAGGKLPVTVVPTNSN